MKHAAPRPPFLVLAIPCMLLSVFARTCPAQSTPHPAMRAFIVWNAAASEADSLDQRALEAAAGTLGPLPDRLLPADLPLARLDSTLLLIVPHFSATCLQREETDAILSGLRNGLRLITDGQSPLSDSLHITLGSPVRVEFVRDHSERQSRVRWWTRPQVPWIRGFAREQSKKLYSEQTTGKLLGMILRVELGKVLFLAPLLEATSGKANQRFPSLPNAILRELGYRTVFARAGAEAYFDPGYRVDESQEQLAWKWREWGIRAVHVGAWYAYDDPPYDYHKLLGALHRNGILAYAWLEWPYVGKGFWDEHPQWRQKNALLKDAHLDFLYLMDLQNPECMARAMADLDSLLREDWDGVDVAEFTMTGAGGEALEGPTRPDYFAGFTDVSRAEFQRIQGFDPVELFTRRSPHYWRKDSTGLNAFYRYRADVNSTTERLLFEALHGMSVREGRNWELILTIVDNALHPEFDRLLGFDMRRTLELVRDNDVTLQIEDPYTEWVKSPERYGRLGSYYQKLLGDRPFVIDINVVPMIRDRKKVFTTIQPTGTELLQLWRAATERTQRVCFYCESSIYESDWETLPHAMASKVVVTADSKGWRVNTPYTVEMNIGGGTWLLDGNAWPCYTSSSILLPAGDHLVHPTTAAGGLRQPPIRLVRISDQLLQAWGNDEGIALDYRSTGRCALTFSTIPSSMTLDGAVRELPLYAGEGECVILAPPGEHHIAVAVW